ncbi:MAG: DUF3267 domain-containing protein [Firmicutes bacterium]|jgi:hypothetical protein|nr:DUF3267 domain-containing protein [Bacillota bacterium]
MKFHYKGKFSGDPDDLPYLEHEPGAVPFDEPQDPKKLGLIANGIALVIAIAALVILFLRGGLTAFNPIGCILMLLTLFPHELLHAVCFRDDVYMYTNLKHGMLFVVGPERMSKGRFVFMSLLPNIVFGFIPFAIYLIWPEHTILGTMGALSISAGAGDFLNVFNALTQMPKGAKTYLHKFNSFWYMPENGDMK